MAKITVQNTEIAVVKYNEEDYISLTDMARSQMQEHIIFRWLSLKSTMSISENGKCSIIPILIVPNSIQLKMPQEATTLCYR